MESQNIKLQVRHTVPDFIKFTYYDGSYSLIM